MWKVTKNKRTCTATISTSHTPAAASAGFLRSGKRNRNLSLRFSVAGIVGVFLHTNAFREDLPQYWNFQEQRLLTPTNATITIVKTATEVLRQLYRQGYHYKKAGVIVMAISPQSPVQQDLFDIQAEQFQKMRRLDAVIDRINRVHGSETIVLGSQQYTRPNGKGRAEVFANAIKHDHRSKNPTTRWKDIIKLK